MANGCVCLAEAGMNVVSDTRFRTAQVDHTGYFWHCLAILNSWHGGLGLQGLLSGRAEHDVC